MCVCVCEREIYRIVFVFIHIIGFNSIPSSIPFIYVCLCICPTPNRQHVTQGQNLIVV